MLRVLILFLTSASVYAAQETPLRLHFGVYPSDRATVMYRKFSPILEAITAPIENQLKRDVDIHLTIFEDYESGIKALAEGTVDFVRFGPSSYILAEQLNPNIQLLAMELRNG
ncbi:MAG: PhnD/SsuA/transferrin family substrate-binding protein, partial [Phycisphaerales bacterium]